MQKSKLLKLIVLCSFLSLVADAFQVQANTPENYNGSVESDLYEDSLEEDSLHKAAITTDLKSLTNIGDFDDLDEVEQALND